MQKFSDKLNVIARDTNAYLKKFFFKKNKYSYLIKPMKYGVFSGGKRFRSAIIVNVGKIFNIDYRKLIIIGAAIECVHSYSLIHDDLPAMDNDDLRRGKLATHKKFNEFTAILAGNSLLTLAFEILSSKNLKLSSKVKNELITSLAIYSGFSGLAGGQYFDLTFENKKISGQEIIVSFAVKPTSSILKTRETIDKKGKNTKISVQGRHDPCVGIRAVPIGEAMMACVLLDHFLLNRGHCG